MVRGNPKAPPLRGSFWVKSFELWYFEAMGNLLNRSAAAVKPWRRTVKLDVLARTLKLVRKKRRMALADVAKEVGLSASMLCRVECRLHTPRVDNLARICKWLDVPVSSFLITGTDIDRKNQSLVYLYFDREAPGPVMTKLLNAIRASYGNQAQ
jgi:transcriptional regulator with XRE-family HTH domain